MNAYAVIIAGGSGSRLWPASTASRPKQFVDLFGGKALIRHAVDRLDGLFPPERTLVITAQRLCAASRRALPTLPPENIIGEPCRRDTGAAVATAAGLVRRLGGPQALGCILTSDHLISPAAHFRRTLADALRVAARSEVIVTMGIKPTYAATGFGYIEHADAFETGTKTPFSRVRRFVEKPDAKTAARYLRSGRFAWNAGMFVWKAQTLEKAFRSVAPEYAALIDDVAASASPAAALRRRYAALPARSFDFAVMEHIDNIVVAKSSFAWDDVGSWNALANHFPADPLGNIRLGRTQLLDTRDAIVVSTENHLVAALGVKDLVIVHTPTATLVCPRDRAEDVKRLVADLTAKTASPRKQAPCSTISPAS